MGGGSIPMTAQKGKPSMYRTQKARGVEAGFGLASEAGNGYRVAVALAVMPHAEPDKLKAVFAKAEATKKVIFARPCPINPRHGFVESRPVANLEDLYKVYQETIDQEPLGEVILMERLSGKYSAVMTATGVAWGRENDGVTSGKGDQRIVPAPGGRFDDIFLPLLGLDPTKSQEGVYIELVEETGVMCVVQMRLGPKQPDSRIKRVLVAPHVTINSIVKADTDDLIAWDKELKAIGRHSKTCLVWLPGQTMASHFAVQAIAQGFNVSVEDKCPVVVGQELQPDKNELLPLNEADLAQMAHYIKQETKTIFWDYPRECLLSVAVLHALPYWDNRDYLLRLRARGAVAAARFALAACLGESRHKPRKEESGEGEDTKPAVPWNELMGGDIGMRYSRPYVFLKAFGVPWDKCGEYASAAAKDMIIPGWDDVMTFLAKGNKLSAVHAGYRGPKWEWAALKCHDLIVSLDKFVGDPTSDNWGLILGFYNEIINAAHNGGYLLNKWTDQRLVDNVATSPALAFGYPQVMNIVWNEAGGLPGQAWLPLNMFPKASMGTYLTYGENVKVHIKVIEHLMGIGKLNKLGMPAGGCKCKRCMAALWMDVGTAAIGLGLPSYVPVDQLANMPYSVVKAANDNIADPYSSAVKNALTPPEDEDEDEDEGEDEGAGECGECGATLEDGECPDEGCPACPNFWLAKKDMEATFDQPEEEAKEPDNGKDVP